MLDLSKFLQRHPTNFSKLLYSQASNLNSCLIIKAYRLSLISLLMMRSERNLLDIELRAQDIQAIDGPNALSTFFARLGYNTEVRTAQVPGNLGITAEGTLRPIKKSS
jgi:hypothetical protein